MISAKGQLVPLTKSNDFSLDLTPLIDIVFIVLVFLLLTANIPLQSLPLEVPDTKRSELNAIGASSNITLNILPSAPHWAINGQPYHNWSEFEQAFKQAFEQRPEATIIIAADKSAPIQPLMSLLDLLQQHAITNTQVLMKPAGT